MRRLRGNCCFLTLVFIVLFFALLVFVGKRAVRAACDFINAYLDGKQERIKQGRQEDQSSDNIVRRLERGKVSPAS